MGVTLARSQSSGGDPLSSECWKIVVRPGASSSSFNKVQSVLGISRKPTGTYFTGYFLGTIPLVSHQERPLEPSWIPNLHVKKHGISRSHPGYLLKVSGITPGAWLIFMVCGFRDTTITLLDTTLELALDVSGAVHYFGLGHRRIGD